MTIELENGIFPNLANMVAIINIVAPSFLNYYAYTNRITLLPSPMNNPFTMLTYMTLC